MNKYPTLKERYSEDRCILNIWIDKDLKAKIKQEAKRHGMLLGKYVERILKESIEDNEEFKKKW